MIQDASFSTNIIILLLTCGWFFALYLWSKRKKIANLSIKEIAAILAVTVICQVVGPLFILLAGWGFSIVTIPTIKDSKGILLRHFGWGILGTIIVAIVLFPFADHLFFGDVSGDFKGYAKVGGFLFSLLIAFMIAGVISSIIAALRKNALGEITK